MLQLNIRSGEFWDESNERFIHIPEQTLTLEHSLLSISKWESKWNKTFLSNSSKTNSEILDYIKCMTIGDVDDHTYLCLSESNMQAIKEYIDAPMSATVIRDDPNAPKNREPMTSELIYYWMIALNIPFECQTWHINRLLTLIKVCSIKQKPPKKMGTSKLLTRNAALNQARRKALNSNG